MSPCLGRPVGPLAQLRRARWHDAQLHDGQLHHGQLHDAKLEDADKGPPLGAA
ncbi:hypothetical protein DB30_04018 [Enhygromyxa salina]|uniref:Uncharacterized protein n=1 Tax=Enhygromyxa salina TaxID=215803 RepID=A0A0C2D0T9_9BACT|nr:hypothetical protein [Enhygromyxa salina]KIG16856.1 hypothetical protein DB30_04018 [Enhygromyxa salina]